MENQCCAKDPLIQELCRNPQIAVHGIGESGCISFDSFGLEHDGCAEPRNSERSISIWSQIRERLNQKVSSLAWVSDWIESNPRLRMVRQYCIESRLTVFTICCLLIAAIGALDTWLVVRYSESIFEMEQNPICLFLLQQDPHDLMVFVYGKSAGIFLVICVLAGLFRYWERIAMKVTYSVTVFQLFLVCYLYVLSDVPHWYRLYIE